VCLRRAPRPGCATRKATSRALASERGLARSRKDPATRGGGACLNGLSDPSWPLFDHKPQSAHDPACRHSLCRLLLARRRPGRQCLCDNPVGDELAEAGAPSRSHRRSRGCRSRGAAQRTVDRPGVRENRRERLQGGAAGDLTGEAAFAQIEFATDSPLERNGFELSVPRCLAAADGMGAFLRR
jgi:hypothetical protein